MPRSRHLVLALFLAACGAPCGPSSTEPITADRPPAAASAEPGPAPAAEPPAAGQAPAEPPPDLRTVEGFWRAFRQAALVNDVDAVANLTRFPLITRGSMDDCPEVRHDRSAFDALWPQLLRTEPGLGHDEDMRGLIQRLAEVPDTERRTVEQSGGHQLRMGDFEFQRSSTSDEFRFTYAYWSADGC